MENAIIIGASSGVGCAAGMFFVNRPLYGLFDGLIKGVAGVAIKTFLGDRCFYVYSGVIVVSLLGKLGQLASVAEKEKVRQAALAKLLFTYLKKAASANDR